MLSDRACNALAVFIAEGRPDFDVPGIVAELRRQREHCDPWQLASAMCKRASDPANTTPRLQPFDRDGLVACARHPGAPTRTDGVCGRCFAEANAVEYEPRTARDTTADPHPLETALARLDSLRTTP